MGLILPRLSATNSHYSFVLQHSLMLNTHAALVMKVTAARTEPYPHIISEMHSYRIHHGKCEASKCIHLLVIVCNYHPVSKYTLTYSHVHRNTNRKHTKPRRPVIA